MTKSLISNIRYSIQLLISWNKFVNTFACWKAPMCIDASVAGWTSNFQPSTWCSTFCVGRAGCSIMTSPFQSITIHFRFWSISSAKVLVTSWDWIFVGDVIANGSLWMAIFSTTLELRNIADEKKIIHEIMNRPKCIVIQIRIGKIF